MKLRIALIAGALLAIVTPLPALAADTTPPSRPGGLMSCPPPSSQSGMVGICWTPSTDDSGSVAGYDVYMLTSTGFVKTSSPTSSPTIVGGLVRGRAYTFYLVARDLSGNVSLPSSFITLTGTTGMQLPSPSPEPGDTQPPSQPQNVRDGCLFDFPGTAFCWDASTDDVGVTGYDVYRQTVGGWIKVGSTGTQYRMFSEGGLVTGQYYTYSVVARDAAGNVSPPSSPTQILARQGLPVPPSPSPSPTAGACEVGYDSAAWTTGMSVWMTLKNTGTTAVNTWSLEFDFPDAGQRVTSGHNATWSQSGRHVTARNVVWNAQIAPGATLNLGFNGAHSGLNPEPTAFTLNGLTCTVKA
ncbi:cellulose binding domain-containing protein [Herbidospora yilanensis]|uniref:cellulose binding domain-containing protein n=1 Tax=Herbidospora yilanensis TaxID=354426 RepID=UPI000784B128|nr:cellulose binding domain-containing protein [Herbidospora yilanensis]